MRADTEQPRVSRLQVLVLCRRSEDERDLAPRRRRRGVPRRKRGRTGRGHGAGVPSLSCPCPLPHSSQQSQCRGGVKDRDRRRSGRESGWKWILGSSPPEASRWWAVADAAAGR